MSLDFRGLLPTELPDDDGTGWFDPGRIRAFIDDIRHLSPFRFKPKRLVRLPAREPDHDESGSRTAEILVYDHVRRKGPLIERINDYLGTSLPT